MKPATTTDHTPKDNQLYPMTNTGIIKVSGPDTVAYLQGQLTLNMDKLSTHQGGIAGHCNIKGRLHYLCFVQPVNDDIWLIINTDILSHAFDVLKKYAMFSQVKLEILSTLSTLGLWTTSSLQLSYELPIKPYAISNFYECHCMRLSQDNLFLITGPQSQIDVIKDSLLSQTSISKNNEWHAMCLIHKLPIIHSSTIEHWLPHHLGLPDLGGVSFDKGCYLGQEIIARMEYRGNIKKHIALLTSSNLEGLIGPKSPLTNTSGQTVGEIVCCAQNQTDSFALAIINDANIDDQLLSLDTELTIVHS